MMTLAFVGIEAEQYFLYILLFFLIVKKSNYILFGGNGIQAGLRNRVI